MTKYRLPHEFQFHFDTEKALLRTPYHRKPWKAFELRHFLNDFFLQKIFLVVVLDSLTNIVLFLRPLQDIDILHVQDLGCSFAVPQACDKYCSPVNQLYQQSHLDRKRCH
ncbi:unnamed protein product [Schistosoma mattheei]|uniref:Uncharacterized protein n=1 Tax=Schistosoma mattheei TaxID=31246 RepID=A0A183P924_9TREM|nr:unnamed protein product [Schistosoma mattheei]